MGKRAQDGLKIRKKQHIIKFIIKHHLDYRICLSEDSMKGTQGYNNFS